jgi:hypothetical protein
MTIYLYITRRNDTGRELTRGNKPFSNSFSDSKKRNLVFNILNANSVEFDEDDIEFVYNPNSDIVLIYHLPLEAPSTFGTRSSNNNALDSGYRRKSMKSSRRKSSRKSVSRRKSMKSSRRKSSRKSVSRRKSMKSSRRKSSRKSVSKSKSRTTRQIMNDLIKAIKNNNKSKIAKFRKEYAKAGYIITDTKLNQLMKKYKV